MIDPWLIWVMMNQVKSICGFEFFSLKFTSRKTIKFFDVLFVPNLHKNLVSGGCLNLDGFKQGYE